MANPRTIARLEARIKERAAQVIANEELPDYPEEMRETFKKLMEEHGLDTNKYLS